MPYQQVLLTKGKTKLVTWVKKDPRVKPGAKVRLARDSEWWTVQNCYSIALSEPPQKDWKVGGLF